MAQRSTTEPRDALKRQGTTRQMDDNIDDLGRRPDGSLQEQPESDQAKRVKEDVAKPKRAKQKHR